MKKTQKRSKIYKLYLYLALTLAILTSCGKDDEVKKTENTAPKIENQSFNASESAKDTDIIGKIEATDDDTADQLTFSITANDNELFEITASGNLSLAKGKKLDAKKAKKHEITVQVSDGKLKASAKVTIVVVSDTKNSAPKIEAQIFSVAENITKTTLIGKVTATDPEGRSLTYSITTNDNDIFEIGSTGNLNLAPGKSLDYESKKIHRISVTVSDGTLSATGAITIHVTNINEKPNFPDRNFKFAVRENINDATVIATVTATDPEGDALSYSLTNNTGNLFRISASGQIRLARHRLLDYESAISHTLTVKATDGKLSSLQNGVKIIVLNVIDLNVSTLAGSSFGFANGPGTAAKFNFPLGMATDAAGNIYVADQSNHRIRKITPKGVVSTYAGSGVKGFANGHRASAQFNFPIGVAIDRNGNMYVSDTRNYCIRKITPAGVVSTFAGIPRRRGYKDGAPTVAKFASPRGIVTDRSSNVFVVDGDAHRIRKITPAGFVSTFAGNRIAGSNDGTGSVAKFQNPEGISIDKSDNLYIADWKNNRIRKITPSKVVTTMAGSTAGFANGSGSQAKFNYPTGVAVDVAGNVYVADNMNHCVRKITPAGVVSTYAGSVGAPGATNGLSTQARFNRPLGIALDASGKVIYVADYSNHRIRKIFEN